MAHSSEAVTSKYYVKDDQEAKIDHMKNATKMSKVPYLDTKMIN